MQRYLLICTKDDEGEAFEVSHYKTLNELIADNPEAIGKDEGHQNAWLEESYYIVGLLVGWGVVANEVDQLDLEAVIFPQEDEEEEEEEWISITINGLPVKVPQGTTWTDIVEKVGSALHNQALGCTPPSNLGL